MYRGHRGVVTALTWSADGHYLASASADETVQVYAADTCVHFYTYRGHTGSVNSLSWSPDSTALVSGGADKIVHVWRVRQ